MHYFMYTDVFVDAGEGWRWRFHVTDEAGLFDITSEEFDEATREWKPNGNSLTLHVQAIPMIREALAVLEKHNEVAG